MPKGTKTHLRDFSIHDGGLIATALTSVARLGGRAFFAGKLGCSDMAERVIRALANENVDTSLVIREQDAEPVHSFVIANADTGERTIFWANPNVSYPSADELPDKKWYEKTRVLLFDHASGWAGVEMAKIARKHNIPVVIDVERNGEHVTEAMAQSCHVIISEGFAAELTGKQAVSDILCCLQSSSQQTVIITRGKLGCEGLTEQGPFQIPAFEVDVVDTTSCGDIFHGAYALAIARGYSVISAARFAGAAAAMSTTRVGGRAGIPNQKQLDEFLKQQL